MILVDVSEAESAVSVPERIESRTKREFYHSKPSVKQDSVLGINGSLSSSRKKRGCEQNIYPNAGFDRQNMFVTWGGPVEHECTWNRK
jgi:hypothetical protein